MPNRGCFVGSMRLTRVFSLVAGIPWQASYKKASDGVLVAQKRDIESLRAQLSSLQRQFVATAAKHEEQLKDMTTTCVGCGAVLCLVWWC